jgi:hypothetical protein
MQQEWRNRVWPLENVQRCWSELIVEADRWPQRVTGPDGDAYVISADLYGRFFDGGIRFDGDEYAHLDVDPDENGTHPGELHSNP